ncbi:MAG: sigma-70 family RNA polymerase sigma factor [Alphaproteobacteria bacterium]|nr:sigma-70 family RNA polymerase sigma factor [Alphaproteobacteria bacterium]
MRSGTKDRDSFVPASVHESGKLGKRDQIIAEIPRLRRFARTLTGDVTAADDLVQDCLLRALGRLSLWRSGSNMRAWLFTILRNSHKNQLRQSARRPTEFPIDEMPDLSDAPTQGHGLALRDLYAALSRLPDDHREIVLLIGLEEMSYKDAARILDIPVGTVMSRLSRGRESLRNLLNDGDQDKRPSLRRVK